MALVRYSDHTAAPGLRQAFLPHDPHTVTLPAITQVLVPERRAGAVKARRPRKPGVGAKRRALTTPSTAPASLE